MKITRSWGQGLQNWHCTGIFGLHVAVKNPVANVSMMYPIYSCLPQIKQSHEWKPKRLVEVRRHITSCPKSRCYLLRTRTLVYFCGAIWKVFRHLWYLVIFWGGMAYVSARYFGATPKVTTVPWRLPARHFISQKNCFLGTFGNSSFFTPRNFNEF